MNHNSIREITKQYHRSTDSNIVGVMYGNKTVNGKLTDEKSVVFFVRKKIPKEELTDEQMLPKQLKIDNEIISTDVVQSTFKLLISDCVQDFYTWRTSPPSNRNQQRPLKGGLSCGNWDNMGEQYVWIDSPPDYPAGWYPLEMKYFVGTMGLLAVDNETNSLVGLTNNHVIIYDAFICSDRDLVPNGDVSMVNNIKGNRVTQPNEPNVYGSSYSVGRVKRYYPLRKRPEYNEIDAALFTIDDETYINLLSSYQQLNLTPSTYEWATTNEIDNLTQDTILYSTGRTTGAKGEGQTKLRYIGHGSVEIAYNMQTQYVTVDFDDVIGFVATTDVPPNPISTLCYDPISGGDSGSALIADINGTKKIIGLVFAGMSDPNNEELTTQGLACRIDRISSLLNVSAWNGQAVNFSDPSDIMEIKINGLSDQPYIDYNGKRYWQAGLINSPVDPTPTPTPTKQSTEIFSADLIRKDNETPNIYRPHSLIYNQNYLYVSERKGSADYSSVYKYYKETLERVNTLTMTSNEDMGPIDTMCISGDKLYLAKESSNGFLRIVEIDVNTFTIDRTEVFNFNCGASPTISTDGTYIYGGTYVDPNPTIFKIRISDLSLISSRTWTNGNRIHGSRINTRTNKLYLTTIPSDPNQATQFARVNLSDLTYDEVEIQSYVKKATDDFAMIDDGIDVWCYVGGEYDVNGYNGVKIKATAPVLDSSALTGFSIKTTYGIFEHDNNLYSTSIDGHIQIIDTSNLSYVRTYLVNNMSGSVFNELAVDTSDRIFVTTWSTSANIAEIEFT